VVQKLYVGNIPFRITSEEIKNVFGQYGEVTNVNIVMDRESGRPRGFCFVEMENAEAAINELNGKDMGGRAIKVNIAQERPRFDSAPRQ